jgi:hypothetical protein
VSFAAKRDKAYNIENEMKIQRFKAAMKRNTAAEVTIVKPNSNIAQIIYLAKRRK